MPVKISKVAKDLNVGTSTIIEFLSKKNITVESNPNARISDEHYKMLLDAFRTDKDQRIKSDNFINERRQERSKPERKRKEEDFISTESQIPTPKIVGKIDLSQAGKPKPAPAPAPEAEVSTGQPTTKDEKPQQQETKKETVANAQDEEKVKADNNPIAAAQQPARQAQPKTADDEARHDDVTVAQAQKLATDMNSGEKTSSLMFGIQWDLVLKFLETKGVSVADLKEDSSSWGNYRNVEFPVVEGNKYAIYNNTILENWEDTSENYTKAAYEIEGNGVSLSTGATERNMKMNIYDISGNVYEMTLEKSIDSNMMIIARGGAFNRIGSEYSSYSRSKANQSNTDCRTGFRSTIF